MALVVAGVLSCSVQAGAEGIQSAAPTDRTVPSGFAAVSPPTVTFDPTTDLLDGDVVTIVGVGFDPGTELGVCETVTPLPVDQFCSYGRGGVFAVTDAAGSFTIEMQVDRILYLPQGPVDCAVPDTCGVIALHLATNLAAGDTLLQFDPSAPLPPAPVITVDPATDLEDRQLVTVRGTGFPRNYPVSLVQCRSDAVDHVGCTIYETYAPSDARGSLTQTFAVERYIHLGGPPTDCTAQGSCLIRARLDLLGNNPEASVPIGFRSAATAAAVPTSPAFTG